MHHADIWTGLDALAASHGLTPSALARRAGLDATAFNPSKRVGPDGRPRWPSTESVARALNAVEASLGDLADLIENRTRRVRVPLIGFAEAGEAGYFDTHGLPTGPGWGIAAFPEDAGERLYALEVSGNSMEPVYRSGDRLIVSPGTPLRPGDRIVVRTTDGEVMAKELLTQTDDGMELGSLNPAFSPRHLARSDISWLARIQWVSQ